MGNPYIVMVRNRESGCLVGKTICIFIAGGIRVSENHITISVNIIRMVQFPSISGEALGFGQALNRVRIPVLEIAVQFVETDDVGACLGYGFAKSSADYFVCEVYVIPVAAFA